MTRALRNASFWLLAAAVAVATGIVIWQSLFAARLWEDEAYNITVPLNMLRGLGYTSDGIFSGGAPTPFDPRISTGPAVLLPIAGVLGLGADIAVGSRVIPALYFVSLLAGLIVLGRRIGGRWGALAAVTVPLTLNTAAGVSPIQGPADVLGEIAAASFIVWALVALRRHPVLSGLLLGFAIQSKYIAFLALPAFGLVLLLQTQGGFLRRLRRAVLPAVMVAVPTVVVEAAALVALGPGGYREHLRATIHFLRTGGQDPVGLTVAMKLQTLADSWFVPAVVVAIAAVIIVVVVMIGAILAVRNPSRLSGGFRGRPGSMADGAELLMLLIATTLGLLTFVGWWSLALHTPLWIRHPAPGLFAFVPLMVAFFVRALRVIGPRAGLVGGLGLAVLVGVQVADHVGAVLSPRAETLSTQRNVAAVVAERGASGIAVSWGSAVSIGVLSGSHVTLWNTPTGSDWPRLSAPGDGTPCAEPVVPVGGYLLCGTE